MKGGTTLEELAENVDKVFRNFDPYEYADSDLDSEQVKAMFRSDPYMIIQILTEMVDKLTD